MKYTNYLLKENLFNTSLLVVRKRGKLVRHVTQLTTIPISIAGTVFCVSILPFAFSMDIYRTVNIRGRVIVRNLNRNIVQPKLNLNHKQV